MTEETSEMTPFDWKIEALIAVLSIPIVIGVSIIQFPALGVWFLDWSRLLTGYFSLILTFALVALYFQQKQVLMNQDRPVVVVSDMYLTMRDDRPFFFVELSNVGEGPARNIRLEIVPELFFENEPTENNGQDENGTDVSHRLSPTIISLTLPESDVGTIPLHQSYIEPGESEHLAQLASLNFQGRFLENEGHQRTVLDSVLDDLASLGVTKLRLKFTLHYDGSVQSYSDPFLDYVIPVDPQMNSKQEFSNGLLYSRYELESRQLEYKSEELE
jgi:hypothetical protein